MKSTRAAVSRPKVGNPALEIVQPAMDDQSWSIARFELTEKKDKILSLRLSKKLLDQLKKKAKSNGLDTQKLVRMILENSVRKLTGSF